MVTKTADNNVRFYHRSDIQMSDREILDRYLNLPKIPCTISSPFRGDDKNPSFRIWEKDNRVYWKDFGTNEGGGIINLLAMMWNIRYEDAIERIVDDTGLPLPHYSLVRRYKGKIKLGGGSTIKVKVRKWKDYDTEFWKSFGISKKMCEFCKVYPISTIFFEKKDEPTTTLRADKYAYAYYEFKDDKCTIKVYQPFSERIKWLSSHDRSTWDLWTQAMEWADRYSDEACIITSSRKDAMCLWQNLNIPAVSLQGEGYIPKPQVMKQLLKRFKKVYLWYDNDFNHTDGTNPGQDNAEKLLELYPQLHNICIPSIYRAKDPSDLYKYWGKETLKQIFNDTKL